MLSETKQVKSYSRIGLTALLASIAAAVLLSLADAYVRSYMAEHLQRSGEFNFLATVIVDFRYLAEQGILAATIFFIGAKFVETRTVLSVGFDRLNSGRISVKGPDDDNIVWIGQRYATPLEARTVSEVLAERLKQSAG